ncbi:MAG: hypothetical protein ACLQDV_27515 [Candidatus Binataceae bacterium]
MATSRSATVVTWTASAALICAIAGCAPSALREARSKLNAGDYAGAHQELVALSAHEDQLTPAERRELKDDLCITEFTIGRSTYPLKEQRRACADAARESDSSSAEVLARIDATMADSDAEQVETAIRDGDLAGAEAAAEDYESAPGADQRQIARWSRKMWKLVDAEEQYAPLSKKSLGSAVAELRREHPDVRKMSAVRFERWVVAAATVDGTPLVRDPKLGKGLLKLELSEPDLPAAALNLDKFAAINDAVVARCGCDARTDIGLGTGGLPAYVVRLDAENHRSEVLILLTGESIGLRVTMR